MAIKVLQKKHVRIKYLIRTYSNIKILNASVSRSDPEVCRLAVTSKSCEIRMFTITSLKRGRMELAAINVA